MATHDSITVDDDGAVMRVRLRGEVDAVLRPQAARAVDQVAERGLPVVLDLGQVTFLDSTGVTFLVQLHEACRRAGLSCVAVEVPDRVVTILSVLGLAEMFALRPRTTQTPV